MAHHTRANRAQPWLSRSVRAAKHGGRGYRLVTTGDDRTDCNLESQVIPCGRDELACAEPARWGPRPVSPALRLPRLSAGGGLRPLHRPAAPFPASPVDHTRRRRIARRGRDRSLRNHAPALSRYRPAPEPMAPDTVTHRRGSLLVQPKPDLRHDDACTNRARAHVGQCLDRRAIRRFADRGPLHRRATGGGVPPRPLRRALSQVLGERSPLSLNLRYEPQPSPPRSALARDIPRRSAPDYVSDAPPELLVTTAGRNVEKCSALGAIRTHDPRIRNRT